MKSWKRQISLLLVLGMVLSSLPSFALAGTELVLEQAVVNISVYPAPDAVVIHTDTVGTGGAPWRLYSDGTIIVDAGFIHWSGVPSPFNHELARRIIFTGPITAGTSLTSLFHFTRVTSIEGLSHFDTRNVTNMSFMFASARDLTNLDMSGFDTSNVTHMTGMFSFTHGLIDLDLSGFDTSNVRNMSSIFLGAENLRNLDVSSFDTSNVTHMSMMFARTFSLNDLDVSHFDTSSVIDMSEMFIDTDLTCLDLSRWDTRNVSDMTHMFSRANSLRQIALGEYFIFRVSRISCDIYRPEGPSFFDVGAELTHPPQNDDYTGYWQNVGSGTIGNPQGEFVLTNTELMETYNGSTMADTWVWQPRNPVLPAHPFTDIAGHWAYNAIQFAYTNNLMTGTSTTTFSPDAVFTRAQLATILWRSEGEPTTTFQTVFSDVPSTAPAWYRDAVIWANENGIVRGFDGRFDPYGEITREQFAAMLHRYALFIDGDVSVPETFNLDNFLDCGEISAWAEPYMYWAVYHGLITGRTTTTIVPGGITIRAEAATILMRFMQRFVM